MALPGEDYVYSCICMFGVFVKCKMLFLKGIFLAPPHSTGGEAAEQSITENLSMWEDLITQVMP